MQKEIEMGGNALKHSYTERKSTKDFLRIASEIQDRVSNDIGIKTTVIKYFHNKTEHGDLDLLLKINPKNNINIKEYIQKSFNPNEIHSNGGVYSFDYDNFQIDFILIKEEFWDVAISWMDYDPSGNIMGKTYHKFDLSYGWRGLYYKFRNFEGRNPQDILISTDPRKIFEFGGYNYDRYLEGFETLEDIMRFTINTKYFDTEMFKMGNLNHIDRKRNKKRKTYHTFLQYLEDNNIYIKHNFHKDKKKYLEMIDEYFPEANLLEKIDKLLIIDKENKIISQKFNGNIVMDWLPNLIGKQLGNAISLFKNDLGDGYNDFILNANHDTIKNRFMKAYSGNIEE